MLRNISHEDLNWKNFSLLSNFVNAIGGIVNKHQSRLPDILHRKMAKTIKHLRSIGFFAPHFSIRATDKVPFSSQHYMFLDEMTRNVDPVTGKIKPKPILNKTEEDKTHLGKYESAKEAYTNMKNIYLI